MTYLDKDKNLSGILILITLGYILYVAGSDSSFSLNNTKQKDNLIEALKITCRKFSKEKTGKKPLTNINLVRI